MSGRCPPPARVSSVRSCLLFSPCARHGMLLSSYSAVATAPSLLLSSLHLPPPSGEKRPQSRERSAGSAERQQVLCYAWRCCSTSHTSLPCLITPWCCCYQTVSHPGHCFFFMRITHGQIMATARGGGGASRHAPAPPAGGSQRCHATRRFASHVYYRPC